MGGVDGPSGIVQAHRGDAIRLGEGSPLGREAREALEEAVLVPGATRALGAGRRRAEEAPDPERTCFERDRDRIVHSKAFRRLAGKTQVFVFPDDHQRTRLTHALEVAQVATAIARACGLNVALTEAIALGHDCGHGPGGHASEAVFDAVLPGGFHHATFGAGVVLDSLNLCAETLDGIASHSWSLPAPKTPEGAVVSWADRIAYCAHDLEDAIHAGIVSVRELPAAIVEAAGPTRSSQLRYFISAMVDTLSSARVVAMASEPASVLAALRNFNYEHIYLRDEAIGQGKAVQAVLHALLEHFVAHPEVLPQLAEGADPLASAIAYVAQMTDRYAFDAAVRLLDWPRSALPRGIDVARL